MEILLFAAVGWFITRWLGYGRVCSGRTWHERQLARRHRLEARRARYEARRARYHARRDHYRERRATWEAERLPGKRAGAGAAAERTSISAEDPIARLQRDWIAGRITDGEYEEGLDAVYAERRARVRL